jgi:hypothetical protein
MARFEDYTHHGCRVWVRSGLKGKHRDACLCFACARFHPDSRDENCDIANLLYAMCRLHFLVTPVWECPRFIALDPREIHGD